MNDTPKKGNWPHLHVYDTQLIDADVQVAINRGKRFPEAV